MVSTLHTQIPRGHHTAYFGVFSSFPSPFFRTLTSIRGQARSYDTHFPFTLKCL
jgi:hypothetical protein